MTDTMDIQKYRQTLQKALMGGISAAQKHNEELILQKFDSDLQRDVRDIDLEIELFDEWITECAEALQWLNGEELAQMEVIYEAARLSK